MSEYLKNNIDEWIADVYHYLLQSKGDLDGKKYKR